MIHHNTLPLPNGTMILHDTLPLPPLPLPLLYQSGLEEGRMASSKNYNLSTSYIIQYCSFKSSYQRNYKIEVSLQMYLKLL